MIYSRGEMAAGRKQGESSDLVNDDQKRYEERYWP
jgi:hypothetical protein